MPRSDRLKVSLFPFMSILACTIGALTFLLVTMAVTSLGVTRWTDEASSTSQGNTAAEAISEIQMPWVSPEERRALSRATKLFAALDRMLEAKGFSAGGSVREIEAEIRTAADQRELEARIQKKQNELARVQRDRTQIETSIEVLESRRKTLPILIDPTDLSPDQTPYFVECDAEGATAYRVRDDFEYFVHRRDISTNGDFVRYLRRVRALPGALLVLLVREEGIPTSNQIVELARNAGIRVSRLPLPGHGPLDFRLLRKAEGS